MDIVFGTFATDDLKLVHHRATRSGLQHAHALEPRDPAPGEPVVLTATCGPDLDATHLACYLTTDGSEPSGRRGVATRGTALALEHVDTVWDSLVWGYLTRWRVVLPAQPDGTVVRYRLGAWHDGRPDTPEVFADWPDATATAERAAKAYFEGAPVPTERETPTLVGAPAGAGVHIFCYHVDTLRPPAWTERAMIYQIVVDRFHPGDGRAWRQTENLDAVCGGTLWGVRDKLDYLADLGATCLWLSPLWPSPSHHGYDVTDYRRVEERLGGDEALRAVVEGAHARGLRVLLDLVCNHLSDRHPFFEEARRDPASPYRDWFHFHNEPDDAGIGYRGFFGLGSMPQLDLTHPAARDWMIDVARRWLRDFDIDGYRLDYANGPGPDFWSSFRAACKEEKPDCFLVGEIIDAPDAVRRYAGRLDGCLDFQTSEALRKTFGYRTWSEHDLERFLRRHHDFFPADFARPTFLDNHDMDRFLYIAGGDSTALERAATAHLQAAGPVVILYGTEVGLTQKAGTQQHGLHAGRVPMRWGDEQDAALLGTYRRLIAARSGR